MYPERPDKVRVELVDEKGIPSHISFAKSATVQDVLNSLGALPGAELYYVPLTNVSLGKLEIRPGLIYRIQQRPESRRFRITQI
ncbi:hypothetical protein A2685_00940 [Candidatus Woesebacteria bacterium RIFCSPHIGHO2_01_FULL_37_10]|uniref:Uncharacterized protein n=1 Tax=Candidatus Woesebacteria bacterium RIFCSPHIGHO2_01_FULL_37_10 TaxID=1802489 RepID=A0A1F7XSK4_9BACT|nr:MAG: hypothetical protein A2685_00940 [Candidatus Woesebacteria bacterium RIFCSPHIGHO2_01_FULL_37_10]